MKCSGSDKLLSVSQPSTHRSTSELLFQGNSILPFALGGRFVHLKSKGDMPAIGFLYLLTLPSEKKELGFDQGPALCHHVIICHHLSDPDPLPSQVMT